MHDDQVDVTEQTVAALVREQFPQWRDQEVRLLESSGTVNAVFRIGEGLSARFPLRLTGADAQRAVLEREAAACEEFARAAPFPAPRPVALGEPGAGYPMPWSVQTWLEGTAVPAGGPGGPDAFAQDLATLIAALRGADTRGRRFGGEGRGGVLTDHDGWMETCFARSEDLLDVPRLRHLWGFLRELPRDGDDVMSHGDLIPGNVLTAGGRLTGVLDAGGYAPADPALDLVAAWHLLDSGPRDLLRQALGCDDLEWERGIAWAFVQAVGLVRYYLTTNPTMSATGRRTLDRVLELAD